MTYADFLTDKLVQVPPLGFTPDRLPAVLKDFQGNLVTWALQQGRAEGVELKPSYFDWAVKHTRQEADKAATQLFGLEVVNA